MGKTLAKFSRIVRSVLSVWYLVLIILTIPLAFDMGGIECGLAFSLTTFLLYFILMTLKVITHQSRYTRWISILYYAQHFFIPSLLTFFLSYYGSSRNGVELRSIYLWKNIIVNSTPVFTILEGFCSLLLIQAIGQTVNWLTVYKSDSWLIVSLIGSGSTITAAFYFLYRIYSFPFTIDIVSASLLGSLLTLTVGLGLFGIVSSKGSMIESSLLFAYIVRCIYEVFPVLSKEATQALSNFFTQATYSVKNDIPSLPPQITNTISQLVPFLASNVPGSFKTIWEFLLIAIRTLTLPLLLDLAYRVGVFYAATKIIPSLYHGASYPSYSPPRTPQLQSRKTSSSSLSHIALSSSDDPEKSSNSSGSGASGQDKTEESDTNFALDPPHHHPPSALIKIIYAYSPCIIIAIYTHLMMSYNGELGTELKIWGFWNPSPNLGIVVHPWQFWNWVNMATTLLLYAAELSGNNSASGRTALTSHWDI